MQEFIGLHKNLLQNWHPTFSWGFSILSGNYDKFSGLDPAHYISLPSYSYDSMLKLTKSVISLPTSIDMVHMLESGKRGGMSFIGTRDLTASNQKGDESEIIYIDANVSLSMRSVYEKTDNR